jgi:hypothetical protein
VIIMGWPNYTINGSPVCQHIFCDNRVNRAIATHKVTQVSEINGHHSTTLVCDEHLAVIRKVLHGNDFVEAL